MVPGMMNKALVASRRILSEGAQASLNEAFCKKVPLEDQKRERGSSKRPLRESAERVRLLL